MLNLKQNILRKQIDKLIKKRQQHTMQSKPIVKVAVLNNPASNLTFDHLKYVQKALGLRSNQFDIITYKEKKDNFNELRGLLVTKDIFSSFGKIKLPEVETFLSKDYDLLLDFTGMSNVYEKFLSLSINANCRVGYQNDEELYDIMLVVNKGDIQSFIDETKRYLTIIGLL